jgi:hypothetical protein
MEKENSTAHGVDYQFEITRQDVHTRMFISIVNEISNLCSRYSLGYESEQDFLEKCNYLLGDLMALNGGPTQDFIDAFSSRRITAIAADLNGKTSAKKQGRGA